MNLEEKIIKRIEEIALEIETLSMESQKLLSSLSAPQKPLTRSDRISGGLSFLKLESLNQSLLELTSFIELSKLSEKAKKIHSDVLLAYEKLKDFKDSKDLPKDLQDFLNK